MTNTELIQEWIDQRYMTATNDNSTMHYTGNILYSYDINIAYLSLGRVHITKCKYSSTTSKHTKLAKKLCKKAGIEEFL